MQNERVVPLSDVAYELNVSTRDLERRCATGLVTDELGMRCVPGGLVRELIAKRDAELAAQHQRRVADQQEAQRQKEARRRERERLDRLHEKQAPLVAQGLDAFAVMKLSAGEFERAADALPTADYLSGGATYRAPKGLD